MGLEQIAQVACPFCDHSGTCTYCDRGAAVVYVCRDNTRVAVSPHGTHPDCRCNWPLVIHADSDYGTQWLPRLFGLNAALDARLQAFIDATKEG